MLYSSALRQMGAYSTGNSASLPESKQLWTGCDATGGAHPDAHMGTTHAIGMVAVGTPGHAEPEKFAPLGGVDIANDYVSADISRDVADVEIISNRALYAISPVFTVVAER